MEITLDTLGHLSAVLRRFQTYRWGYVRFWRSEPQNPHIPVRSGGFNGVFPVMVLGEPERWKPDDWALFLEQLEVDAYCSINTLYGARFAAREESYTRLNAAYVDLDYGHGEEGPSDEEAVAAIDELVDQGTLPRISTIEFSGRGMRVYWELGETEEEWAGRIKRYEVLHGGGLTTDLTRPPHLSPDEFRAVGRDSHETDMEKLLDLTRWRPHAHSSSALLDGRGIRRLRGIQTALGRRIDEHYPELVPDPRRIDTAASQRVCGSLNSKAGKRVSYSLRLSADSETAAIYTLGELETILGIEEEPASTVSSRQTSGLPRNEEMFKRQRQRYSQLWEELRILQHCRGCFREGSRNHAALYAAAIMHGMGWPQGRIREEVFSLAADCEPPLTEDEAWWAYRSGVALDHRPRNQKVATDLAVTVEEAERIGLRKLRPDFEYQQRPGTQKAQRQETLAQLSELAEGDSLPYSLSELENLTGKSRSTLRRYLKDLGLSSKGQGVSNVQVREELL